MKDVGRFQKDMKLLLPLPLFCVLLHHVDSSVYANRAFCCILAVLPFSCQRSRHRFPLHLPSAK